MNHKETIERYFTAWTERDWEVLTELLADDFTFTSPYDNHITFETYKTKCWDTVKSISPYKIQEVVTINESSAYVRYHCTINDKPLQNVERFTFAKGKIASVEVYFGWA